MSLDRAAYPFARAVVVSPGTVAVDNDFHPAWDPERDLALPEAAFTAAIACPIRDALLSGTPAAPFPTRRQARNGSEAAI